MATELGKAYVQIMPSAVGLQDSVSKLMDGTAETAGRSSGQKLGSSLAGTLKKVLAAAGIGAALKSAIESGSGFETAVAKVATIADTGAVSVQELNSQILNTSGSMGIAAGNIAEAAYQAISAGQDTSNAVDFAAQASKLAAAGFTTSASAVDILTTALNAYGMDAEQANHVSDVLLTTQNLGKTSVDELAGSMGRVIPLAAAYGVSVENLSSGLAIMTANGIATAEAATYTKSMLNELGDSGSKVGQILQEQTGKGFAELNAEGASLGDVLQILYDSVDGNSTKFAGLWSSVEAGTGALSLASSGADNFNSVLGKMVDSTGATESAYATMTDTFQHKTESLKTNVQNFGISVFDSISSGLGDAVGLLSGYVQTLTDSFQSGGFSGLVSGIGDIFADLISNVGPQLLQSGVELAQDLGQGLIDSMDVIAASAVSLMQGLAGGLRDNLPTLIQSGLSMLTDLSASFHDNVGLMVDAAMELALNLAQGLADSLPTIIEQVPTIVSNIANTINDNAPKILETGIQIIITLIGGLIQAIPTLVSNIPRIISAIVDVIEAFNWLNLGKSITEFLGKGIKSMVSFVRGAGNDVLTGIANAIGALPSKLMELGKNGIRGLGSAISGMAHSAVGAMKAVGTGLLNVLKGLPSQMLGIGKNLIKGLWNGISNMTGWILNLIGGFAKSVIGKIKGLFGIHSPSTVFAEIGGYLAEGLGNGWTEEYGAVERGLLAGVSDTADAVNVQMEKAVRSASGSVTADLSMHVSEGENDSLLAAVNRLAELLKSLKVYLDTGVLVGVLAPELDQALGKEKGRRVRQA
ncbi:MAG: phage tail tape measure protein [Eubacteriales bacterium]|nr:phage tail tape measure protein [Eubacteriales bacterium]